MQMLPLRSRCVTDPRATTAAPLPPVVPAVRRSALTAVLLLLSLSAPLTAQSQPDADAGGTYLALHSAAAPAGLAIDIPVAGVAVEDLRDSFRAPRSGGRTHFAIDIHAPRGTPVIAAADGKIMRLDKRGRGGLSVYQLDRDGRTRYYYAHLDRFADGITEGRHVRRGETIGYVGDTGNAAPGDYHLHFSVAVLSNVQRWWEGRNLNPYALLVRRRPPAMHLASTPLPRIDSRLP